MKLDKLKEIVLLLIAIILSAFIIKYLKIFSYLKLILGILVPLFVGFIYAWLLDPLITKLSKGHKRNFICIALFLFIVLVISLFFYLLIPTIYKEISELGEILPSFFNILQRKITDLGLSSYLDRVLNFLLDNIPLYLVNIVKVLFKYLGVTLVGLILGLYMSMDYEVIIEGINKIVPSKYQCVFTNLTKDVSTEVRKCVNGTLFIAFWVFVMDTILFMIVGLDASLLLGILCGITDLIPYIGPYIGGILAVCVGFTESKMMGIVTIVICVLVQSIENYVLQPIVMSKKMKIRPIIILIGLLLFGNLFGIMGMILATPIIAIIKVSLEHLKLAINKCKE